MPEEIKSGGKGKRKMGNDGFGWKVLAALTVLVLSFVGGTTVYTAMAQSALEPRVTAVEKEVELRGPAVHRVAVLEANVSNTDEKVDMLTKTNSTQHKAILEQMVTDRKEMKADMKEILEAIKDHNHYNKSG